MTEAKRPDPRERHQAQAKRIANEIMYRTGWPAPNAYELTRYLMLVIDEPDVEAIRRLADELDAEDISYSYATHRIREALDGGE